MANLLLPRSGLSMDLEFLWLFHPKTNPQTAHSVTPAGVLPWTFDDCAEKPSLPPQMEASQRCIRASENSTVGVGCMAVGGRRLTLSMS